MKTQNYGAMAGICLSLIFLMVVTFSIVGRGSQVTNHSRSSVGGTSQVGLSSPEHESRASDETTSVLISDIQFLQKKPDFGGEACLAMYLRSLGYPVDQDFVFDCSGLDPVLGRGCVTSDLVAAATRIGFETGQVWYPATDDSDLETVWNEILLDLRNKVPSVVCRNCQNVEQFVLVIGHDAKSDKVIFHNPNEVEGQQERIDRTLFLKSCRLKVANAQRPASLNAEKQQTLVRLRLVSHRLNVAISDDRRTDADYAQHIRELKTRLPNDSFRIVLQKPFVVVGDGGLENVKRSASATVKWAVDSIKKDYFEKDPQHIIDVWLFKDPESYQKHNKILFDKVPNTPYGYYSPINRALVMDISTGGGTLVHEIVHPFIESNFAQCPSWFNEGLASLYEQSSSRNGHIVGLTNWRLRGLQLALDDNRVPSFKELCSTSRREFYEGNSTNYAQARYLCYYLQEKGLLVKFYHAFRKNVASDPTGFRTLQQVLKRTDMTAFEQQWAEYVLKLRF